MILAHSLEVMFTYLELDRTETEHLEKRNRESHSIIHSTTWLMGPNTHFHGVRPVYRASKVHRGAAYSPRPLSPAHESSRLESPTSPRESFLPLSFGKHYSLVLIQLL